MRFYRRLHCLRYLYNILCAITGGGSFTVSASGISVIRVWVTSSARTSVYNFTTPVSEELNVKWWNCLMLAILLKYMSLNFFCQSYVCTRVSSLSLSSNCTWFILVTGVLSTMQRHISDTEHIWLLRNLTFNTPNPASGANFVWPTGRKLILMMDVLMTTGLRHTAVQTVITKGLQVTDAVGIVCFQHGPDLTIWSAAYIFTNCFHQLAVSVGSRGRAPVGVCALVLAASARCEYSLQCENTLMVERKSFFTGQIYHYLLRLSKSVH